MKRLATVIPAILTLTLVLLTATAHAHPDGELFADIIEKTKPAVVYIQVEREDTRQNPYEDDPELSKFFGHDKKKTTIFSKTQYNYGSGFLFSPDGYILTNSHVINGAKKITVTLDDKSELPATLIGADKKTDIGLIRIDPSELDHVPHIELGNSDTLRAGHWVLAIGSPYKNIQSVTAGIISATGRNTLGISDYENYIQTDAAINPGNSGGPLINIKGEAIGINTAFQTQTGGYIGIGFAVPINMVRQIAGQLIATGNVTRAWLGVAMKDATPRQRAKQNLPEGTHAARVVEVKADSPAQRAGIQKGDLITGINTIAISGGADVRNRISLTPPGSEITIQISRNGTPRQIQVKLAELTP